MIKLNVLPLSLVSAEQNCQKKSSCWNFEKISTMKTFFMIVQIEIILFLDAILLRQLRFSKFRFPIGQPFPDQEMLRPLPDPNDSIRSGQGSKQLNLCPLGDFCFCKSEGNSSFNLHHSLQHSRRL